jgi:hypothetical protein
MYLDIYRRLSCPVANGPGGASNEKLNDWQNVVKMDGSLSSQSSTHGAIEGQTDSSKLFHRRPSWWTRMSLDNWVWEISAALLCICILAAIGGILFAYDNRRVPDLPDGLNVSTLYGALDMLGGVLTRIHRSTQSYHSSQALPRLRCWLSLLPRFVRRSGSGS